MPWWCTATVSCAGPTGRRPPLRVSDPAESIGLSIYDFVEPISTAPTVDRISRLLADGGVLGSAEAHLRSRSGESLVVETRAARTVWDGRPAVQVVVWDVTERYRSSTQLEWEASHDPLTGVWNRRAVLRHLEGLLEAGHEAEVGVALIDLEGFKAVNDTLGHPTGDRVLALVAARLQSLAMTGAVGRLGGDEFLVVCANGPGAAREMAQRIRIELHLDRIDELDLPAPLTATVGVAAGPSADMTVERLLAAADDDLYRQRRASRRSPAGEGPSRPPAGVHPEAGRRPPSWGVRLVGRPRHYAHSRAKGPGAAPTSRGDPPSRRQPGG